MRHHPHYDWLSHSAVQQECLSSVSLLVKSFIVIPYNNNFTKCCWLTWGSESTHPGIPTSIYWILYYVESIGLWLMHAINWLYTIFRNAVIMVLQFSLVETNNNSNFNRDRPLLLIYAWAVPLKPCLPMKHGAYQVHTIVSHNAYMLGQYAHDLPPINHAPYYRQRTIPQHTYAWTVHAQFIFYQQRCVPLTQHTRLGPLYTRRLFARLSASHRKVKWCRKRF